MTIYWKWPSCIVRTIANGTNPTLSTSLYWRAARVFSFNDGPLAKTRLLNYQTCSLTSYLQSVQQYQLLGAGAKIIGPSSAQPARSIKSYQQIRGHRGGTLIFLRAIWRKVPLWRSIGMQSGICTGLASIDCRMDSPPTILMRKDIRILIFRITKRKWRNDAGNYDIAFFHMSSHLLSLNVFYEQLYDGLSSIEICRSMAPRQYYL